MPNIAVEKESVRGARVPTACLLTFFGSLPFVPHSETVPLYVPA